MTLLGSRVLAVGISQASQDATTLDLGWAQDAMTCVLLRRDTRKKKKKRRDTRSTEKACDHPGSSGPHVMVWGL